MIDEQIKPEYVVGFYFNAYRDAVVLIRKNKPEQQAGKLNGVGGKVEPEETPIDAMVREFAEETGKHTSEDSWRFFAVLKFRECNVHFFEQSGEHTGILTGGYSLTDEQVEWVCVRQQHLHRDVLPNLRWLIPLALNKEPPVIIEQ